MCQTCLFHYQTQMMSNCPPVPILNIKHILFPHTSWSYFLNSLRLNENMWCLNSHGLIILLNTMFSNYTIKSFLWLNNILQCIPTHSNASFLFDYNSDFYVFKNFSIACFISLFLRLYITGLMSGVTTE